MLHGRVVRPPAIGAKLESVDDGALKKIPGIVKVVREGNFLAVVASNEWDAIRGANALKATWSKSETLPDQAKLWDYVRDSKVAKLEEYGKTGDTAAAMAADGVKKLSATYDFAIHTHGSIGPSCAIAEFKDGTLDVVVGIAGDPQSAQATGADVFACRPKRCTASMWKAPAATAATATRMPPPMPPCSPRSVGKPVRVQWSRADEHGWDPKGPPTLMDMRASYGRRGQRDGMGRRLLHAAADAGRFLCAAGGGDALRHAGR